MLRVACSCDREKLLWQTATTGRGYLVALAVGYPRPGRVPHTLWAQVDIHHGSGTECCEIEASGFGAKLLVPCPLVLHIPLGHSRTRRVLCQAMPKPLQTSFGVRVSSEVIWSRPARCRW